MKTNSRPKKKCSKNKGKKVLGVIIGVVILSGMSYIIVKQQGNILSLKKLSVKTEADVKLLKEVVHGNVIHSLRETYKRKLMENLAAAEALLDP